MVANNDSYHIRNSVWALVGATVAHTRLVVQLHSPPWRPLVGLRPLLALSIKHSRTIKGLYTSHDMPREPPSMFFQAVKTAQSDCGIRTWAPRSNPTPRMAMKCFPSQCTYYLSCVAESECRGADDAS